MAREPEVLDTDEAGEDPPKWVTLGISLTPELKAEFEALAERYGLKASQYGRTLIADRCAMERRRNDAPR